MRIAVAMSGGVDSSVTAALLKLQGHDVTGITLRFIPHSDISDIAHEKALNDSISIAEMFKFPHYEFDFSDDFRQTVIDPFCSDYLSGRTPNPCIICNRYMKFDRLLAKAGSLGCEMLATGHYVIKKFLNGRYYLSRADDDSKDQSYFLFMLSQEQLSKSLFPLGTYQKNDIRGMAAEWDIPVKAKPDSQEICFIPGNDYPEFIQNYMNTKPVEGDIIDKSGNIIGTHNGIFRYTVGQRRGMGISSSQPLYVIKIDAENNRIIAGSRDELQVRTFYTENCYEMKYEITEPVHLYIKTRSTQRPARALVSKYGNGYQVEFDSPQPGITPGQGAVFYDDDGDIIGGGIIGSNY